MGNDHRNLQDSHGNHILRDNTALKRLLSGLSVAALGFGVAAPAMAQAQAAADQETVCQALGISGITISSNNTCLSFSGLVEYEFEYERDADGEGESTSELDWELEFQASAVTGLGPATATLLLVPQDVADPDAGIKIDEAFVSLGLGENTVLTAGDAPTMMPQVGRDQYILSNLSVSRPGGHSVQFETLLAEGIAFGIGLEDMEEDGALVAIVEYERGNIEAALGGLLYNFYDYTESDANPEWRLYGDILYEAESWEAFLAFVSDNKGYKMVSSLAYEVGDFLLLAAYGQSHDKAKDTTQSTYGLGFEYEQGPWEAEFALISVDFDTLGMESALTYELSDTMELEVELEIDDFRTDSDREGRVTLITALSDTLELETWGGFRGDAGDPTYYEAGVELVYEPTRDLEASIAFEAGTDGAAVFTVALTQEF